MKQIILKKLELINFKGIAHRIEEFHNGENFIFGANGTGKTTLFDAFTWVLFGRDSAGQSDNKANIKTLDKDNKPIMGMDNTVIATFEVDGQELVLQRSYVEVWTKHSGQADKTYEGQTTKYSWDGNDKVSKTEFNSRVKELIDDGLFKLITDPNYFASLDVKERRKIVLAMAGDITNEEIKFFNDELLNFDAKKDVDEQRQVAMTSKNKLVKDRDNYPARIDEQMQTITRKEQELKEMVLPNKEELEAKKANAEKQLADLEAKQNDVAQSIEEIMDKNVERMELLRKIEQYKQSEQELKNSNVDRDNKVVANAKEEYLDKQYEIERITTRINNGKSALETKKQELEMHKADLKALQDTLIPSFETETICPTCQRELDASTIEESKQLLTENWTKEQKRKIAETSIRCNNAFEEGKQYKELLAKLEVELATLNTEKDALKESAEVELKKYEIIDFEIDPVYQGMIAKLPEEISISEEIENQKQVIASEKGIQQEIIKSIAIQMVEFTKVDIMNSDIENAKKRIEQLRIEEKGVNIQIATQEKIIYLCDLWTKSKTEILNKRVASKFNKVKFKMFNYTKDGNPVPTCEIVVDGVDYVSLNTASRINAGLDIINALIKHYEVKAPIFIDGRESVTSIDAPDTQIINLVVKERN